MTLPDLSIEEKELAVILCALNDLVDKGWVRVNGRPIAQITPKGISLADQFRAEGIRSSIESIVSVIDYICAPDIEELFWLSLLVYLWLEDPDAVEAICVSDHKTGEDT